MQNKNEFTGAKIEDLLAYLMETSKPLWGIMTPQHATEHLTLSVKASVGKTKPIIVVTDEAAEKNKKALIADDSLWPQGLKNPLLPSDKLFPLKYASLREAKSKLIFAVYEFEQYYKDHPDAHHPNPFTGYMNYDEWLQFHFKHFRHHFIQFGLLDNLYEEKVR